VFIYPCVKSHSKSLQVFLWATPESKIFMYFHVFLGTMKMPRFTHGIPMEYFL
jgi:hypothetical protein